MRLEETGAAGARTDAPRQSARLCPYSGSAPTLCFLRELLRLSNRWTQPMASAMWCKRPRIRQSGSDWFWLESAANEASFERLGCGVSGRSCYFG